MPPVDSKGTPVSVPRRRGPNLAGGISVEVHLLSGELVISLSVPPDTLVEDIVKAANMDDRHCPQLLHNDNVLRSDLTLEEAGISDRVSVFTGVGEDGAPCGAQRVCVGRRQREDDDLRNHEGGCVIFCLRGCCRGQFSDLPWSHFLLGAVVMYRLC